MTDSNYTQLVVVSDRSGSMMTIVDDAQGAINSFLKDQKEVPGRATLTFVEFDDSYDVVYDNIDLQKAEDYFLMPRGMTALYDAIGRTINSVGDRLAGLTEDERLGTVVFVIVTDGHENASREFTANKIKEMIERQTNEYSWRFVFLAANQDAVQTGGAIGISPNLAVTYGANSKGTQSVFAATSGLVTNLRSGNLGAQYSDSDREEALGTR